MFKSLEQKNVFSKDALNGSLPCSLLLIKHDVACLLWCFLHSTPGSSRQRRSALCVDTSSWRWYGFTITSAL